MSLLTKASLIATPTAYGDGVLNSVKPTNGDGDFDFARASAATRVNEQGLIEKERGNLILQSNSFDTTWSLVNASVTSGQSGYDGSSDAWLLEKSASAGYLRQNNASSNLQTYSIYAKSGTLNWVVLESVIIGSSYFDLQNGVVGNASASLIDKNIDSIGNGWYRISITYNATISQVRVFPADSNGSVSGTSGSIYIQDAQLEQGLVATDYIETTTAAVYEGITDNIPRINYDNGIGSFLLEPQRTNLVAFSEYILGSDWNQLGGALTIAQNTTDTLSPEGKYNAGKITLSSATNRYFASQGYNLGGLNNLSASVYLKSDGADITGKLAFFNGTGGDVITITNQWQRFEINKTATNSTEYFGLDFRDSGHSTSGNVYCYGWQLENNASYPTSYIPTYGASVTFASETCNNAGDSSLFNDSEGVLYAEVSFLDKPAAISISGGSFTNRALFYLSGSGSLSAYAFVGGVNQCNITISGYAYSDMSKLAFKYKENDFALWINGVEVGTDTSGTTFSSGALTELSFDANGAGADIFYGKTKMVSTFKEALSDSELECLTSWSSFNRMATAQGYTIQ